MKKLLGLMFAMTLCVIVCSLSSCSSRSESRPVERGAPTPDEKIVILDAGNYIEGSISNSSGAEYVHKVKRIEKGVVQYVKLRSRFGVGDTLLYRFNSIVNP